MAGRGGGVGKGGGGEGVMGEGGGLGGGKRRGKEGGVNEIKIQVLLRRRNSPIFSKKYQKLFFPDPSSLPPPRPAGLFLFLPHYPISSYSINPPPRFRFCALRGFPINPPPGAKNHKSFPPTPRPHGWVVGRGGGGFSFHGESFSGETI